MIKEFLPLSVVDIPAFENFNDQLKSILEKLDDNTIFTENYYSIESFKSLLISFVNNQRDSLGRTKSGSWSLAPNDDGMDSDVRVDFIFRPTYLVTAILSRTFCDYSELVESIPHYRDSLMKGMLFCSYRNLAGHGYEKDVGTAEALTILSMGKVPFLLEKNKDLCPPLYESIQTVTKEMRERLESKETYGAWGENLQEDFCSALETLYIKNDKEFYDTIKNTDKNPKLLNEGDLLW